MIALALVSSEAAVAAPFSCANILDSIRNGISRVFEPARSLEQLKIEKAHAKSEFEADTNLLQVTADLTEEDRDEVDRLIAKISIEQTKYCDLHNRMIPEAGGYLLVPLDAFYVGENFAKSHYHRERDLTAPILHGIPVHYYTDDERQNAHVHFRDGMAFNADGSQIKNIFGMEYVMDEDGEIYIMPHYSNLLRGDHTLRHASLINGRPVAAAGTISFGPDGRIERITRLSGHYLPTRKNLKQFVERLKSLGMDLTKTVVTWNVD